MKKTELVVGHLEFLIGTTFSTGTFNDHSSQVSILFIYSFGHCGVCPSSIYEFLLPLWYLQALLTNGLDVYHNREPCIKKVHVISHGIFKLLL
jgi:hypothetical protein